ncbi:hypothetical protein [Klebsiella aerogenes]|uniref:hypothetical protein n=1 Tax=Klebsiella aerogenes TaxID=548 RepID=UPI003D3506C0
MSAVYTSVEHQPAQSSNPEAFSSASPQQGGIIFLMSSLTYCLARRVTPFAASMFRFDGVIKHHVDLLVNTVLIISVCFIPFC